MTGCLSERISKQLHVRLKAEAYKISTHVISFFAIETNSLVGVTNVFCFTYKFQSRQRALFGWCFMPAVEALDILDQNSFCSFGNNACSHLSFRTLFRGT